ncbi:MAG: methylated-DNA--[protein]-cysteine S-methyltransferase, partial [Bacteroidota bacterium]
RAADAFGMTPGTWRRGGAGAVVRYAVFDTALGAALVAATDRGVCAVALGDDAETLEADLRADLWAADVARDDAAVGPWAEPVLRALAGAPSDAARALLDLPVDVRGTAFQRRVWAALREIPPGETRTYGEVAAALGRPTASRAVAGACASNRLALVVPCHRVVGAGGALRGYRWGPDRKRRLLTAEASSHNPLGS